MNHDLFERLRALRLPVGEFVIFGSGPLVVSGRPKDLEHLAALERALNENPGLTRPADR